MTKSALAMIMLYVYYPTDLWVWKNPPEEALFNTPDAIGFFGKHIEASAFGEPSAYNEWVDLYWSTHGPVYDYEEWKRSR